jgi:hypothetical protein
LFGMGGGSASAQMVSAELYDQYHVLIFLICAVIIWGFRQSWDYAQHLNAHKLVVLTLLFLWSIGVMITQSYNPFIYFAF